MSLSSDTHTDSQPGIMGYSLGHTVIELHQKDGQRVEQESEIVEVFGEGSVETSLGYVYDQCGIGVGCGDGEYRSIRRPGSYDLKGLQ